MARRFQGKFWDKPQKTKPTNQHTTDPKTCPCNECLTDRNFNSNASRLTSQEIESLEILPELPFVPFK